MNLEDDLKKLKIQLDFERSKNFELIHLIRENHRILSLGSVATGLPHQVNNPLAIIGGYAVVLIKRLEALGEEASESVAIAQEIKSTVARVSQVVESLRVITRPTVEDIPKTLSISSLIETALSLCSEMILKRGIEIKSDRVDDGKILCRESQIVHAIVSLLLNAADSVEHGAKPLVEIRAEIDGNFCNFSCIDNGPMIDKTLVDAIFLPFFTTHKDNMRTGLGLTLTREIAAEHGGSLELAQDGEEKQFIFSIPIHE